MGAIFAAAVTTVYCWHGPLQLLEFSVKQGWEPLCKFLEVPVPAEPFPRVNSTEEMTKGLKRSVTHCVLVAPTVPTGCCSSDMRAGENSRDEACPLEFLCCCIKRSPRRA